MPLFVSFHPHSTVKFEVKLEDNTKLSTFLATISKWFEGLRILDITKNSTDDERIS